MLNNNITEKEEYDYRIRNRSKDELDRAKKYGCDGICYGCRFMCPRVEYCPETRFKEGLATLFAVLTILAIPFMILVLIIILLIKIF